VAAGAATLSSAAGDLLLPEVAVAVRKGGRLLRWMGNEGCLLRLTWEECVDLLRCMLSAAKDSRSDGCEEARLLLSEVPTTCLPTVAWSAGLESLGMHRLGLRVQ
jgi:hypothetical protein